jgi:hypothetical protein
MMSLALVIEHHAHALEYDLMTRTGRTLAEYVGMGAAGLVALVSFIIHLTPDSVLYRETHPRDDLGMWSTTVKTNAILADIYDAFAQSHTKKGRKAKPYPRPNAKDARTIGRGAIRVRDFEQWWESG